MDEFPKLGHNRGTALQHSCQKSLGHLPTLTRRRDSDAMNRLADPLPRHSCRRIVMRRPLEPESSLRFDVASRCQRIAKPFDAADATFNVAASTPQVMKADFTEYRLQPAFDVGKRAPCDEGSNLATQVADRRSTCFGGGAIRIADREPHLAKYMDLWRESNVNRVPLCGAACSVFKSLRPRHSEISIG
jgi:hypothetical protein